MSRDSFILYTIHKDAWLSLSDEDAGRLIKAVLRYQSDEPFDLPPVPSAIFSIIKAYLDRDAAKWAQTVEKRRAAGAKGGAASGESRRKAAKQIEANEANASSTKQSQANEANASFAKQTKQSQANQANPSCIDMSCCVYDSEEKKIYINNSTYPAHYSPEDIEEASDAVRRDRQRGDYEFNMLRSEYDRARPEGPMAGRAEFMALYHSGEWPGIDEILAGLSRLLEGDYQFIDKTYTPGLAKFLSQQLWKMAPRKPQPKPGQEPEKTAKDKALDEKIAKMRAEMKAKEAARKKARGGW